ncbi:SET domain protein [Peniophora sp. CONT]|nr:SET domain protein [Peniophora sp. CONT]
MSSQKRIPKHWPANLRYLREPVYHTSVTPDVLAFLRRYGSGTDRSSTFHDAPSSHSSCIIRPITDAHHPAYDQNGLFYSKKLPPHSFVLDYIGDVHSDERLQSDYDLSLHRFADGTSIGIDAARMGNEARFINDYRGIRDKPNAEFRERRTAQGELRMSVWTITSVQKGEEILVSYGKSWWKSRSDIQTPYE